VVHLGKKTGKKNLLDVKHYVSGPIYGIILLD